MTNGIEKSNSRPPGLKPNVTLLLEKLRFCDALFPVILNRAREKLTNYGYDRRGVKDPDDVSL
jgi:hypothetical protein